MPREDTSRPSLGNHPATQLHNTPLARLFGNRPHNVYTNTFQMHPTPPFSPNHDVLWIDIDNTLTQFIGPPRAEGDGFFIGQSLLWLMRQLAINHYHMPVDQVEQTLRTTHDTVSWWDWADFLRALNLDPPTFWQYACEHQRDQLIPLHPGLPAIFDRLHTAGYRMHITSNNPPSGILHKLRLAGLADPCGSRYFLQFFTPADQHAKKADPEFWRRALAQTGLPPQNVIVIGDSQHDDIDTPFQAGIHRRIHLSPTRDEPPQQGVHHAPDWHAISKLLLG